MNWYRNKIKVGIIGGAGYTGGELIRLLLNHQAVKIVFVHSNSQTGIPIYDIHTDLIGETALLFTSAVSQEIDVLFLCVSHGVAKEFLSKHTLNEQTKIIDLSQDFRLKTEAHDFVYGLPELNMNELQGASKVANPGCFATCIQLALLPLAKKKLLNSAIHISATTGSTGAGQSLNATSHFSWRHGNLSVYKAFEHQHLMEIAQSLRQLQPSFEQDIHFIPHRGSFTRGILASIYINCPLSESELYSIYDTYYSNSPYVHITTSPIDLKQVVNTNKCLIQIQKHGEKVLLVSAIDNLLKGASGQAVQNMNLLFGLPETEGLKLKALAF